LQKGRRDGVDDRLAALLIDLLGLSAPCPTTRILPTATSLPPARVTRPGFPGAGTACTADGLMIWVRGETLTVLAPFFGARMRNRRDLETVGPSFARTVTRLARDGVIHVNANRPCLPARPCAIVVHRLPILRSIATLAPARVPPRPVNVTSDVGFFFAATAEI
jgi:hypothetical protein